MAAENSILLEPSVFSARPSGAPSIPHNKLIRLAYILPLIQPRRSEHNSTWCACAHPSCRTHTAGRRAYTLSSTRAWNAARLAFYLLSYTFPSLPLSFLDGGAGGGCAMWEAGLLIKLRSANANTQSSERVALARLWQQGASAGWFVLRHLPPGGNTQIQPRVFFFSLRAVFCRHVAQQNQTLKKLKRKEKQGEKK